ncbi:hypothetical protein C8R45DRAFT_1106478 [Mycena sanguinolenta]|nr:hypothetical protein C8R45DRAFT_1106478 [Mycena sanguinolenta]
MPTTISVPLILLEQIERTRQSSKADIERFIEESKRKILSLDLQIGVLRVKSERFRPLVELREREYACVKSLRYIIAPIRTLPIELLVEIFRHAIRHHVNNGIRDVHHITQVCSHWRKVAHAAPPLWTGPICIDLSDGRRQLYVDGLEAWLARSASLNIPISLEVNGSTIDPRTVELVLGIAPRLRSLRCDSCLPMSFISRLAACRLDNLEELGLPRLADRDPNMSEFPALTMVPRLRKSRMSIQSDEPHILIPWAQLTDLNLDSNSLDIILGTMVKCTALIYASIHTSSSSVHIGAQRSPLTFCHLHILSLRFDCPQSMAQFLGSVSTPALEELDLSFLRIQRRVKLEVPLAAFLARSPNITRLRIACGLRGLPSHHLIAVLGRTPRLTYLRLAFLHRHSLDDALLGALSYKDGVVPLVPHLRNLDLVAIKEDGFTTVAFEHMLASRWHADAEATSAPPAVARWSHVVLWDEYSQRLMDSMEMLQHKGLPLEIKQLKY